MKNLQKASKAKKPPRPALTLEPTLSLADELISDSEESKEMTFNAPALNMDDMFNGSPKMKRKNSVISLTPRGGSKVKSRFTFEDEEE